jgi:hypothetical protein
MTLKVEIFHNMKTGFTNLVQLLSGHAYEVYMEQMNLGLD